jgi:hypothetical protein
MIFINQVNSNFIYSTNNFFKRSQISESATKKQEDQPCFPTHNDRIAFINQFTIGDRCVKFTFFLLFFI